MEARSSPRGSPVAVVTGAASGIGRAFVEEFLSRGYSCVASDLDAGRLDRMAAELSAWGGRLGTKPADVSVANDLKLLADFCFSRYGSVDVLVNNAGALGTGRSWETPIERWRQILDVNLFGVVHALHAFVPRLIAQDRGHIVNVASLAALTSGALVGPYSASKHGVLAVSECVARELRDLETNVRVSVVFPGAVATNIAADLDADAAGQEGRLNRRLQESAANGMSPNDVARHVLDAIARNEFGVFPDGNVKGKAQDRLTCLLAGTLG